MSDKNNVENDKAIEILDENVSACEKNLVIDQNLEHVNEEPNPNEPTEETEVNDKAVELTVDENGEIDECKESANTNETQQIDIDEVETTETTETTKQNHSEKEIDNVTTHTIEPNIKNNAAVNSNISKFERKKKRKMIVSKMISIAIWAIAACLLFMCVSNLYQQVWNRDGYTGFFGIGNAKVASKSMEPELYANDLIFYKATDINEIKADDIVVYKKTNSSGDTMLIVHKVIQISDGFVITKGVNNTMQDEAFPTSDIVGKYMFKISKAGVLLNLISDGYAPLIIILIMLVALIIRVAAYFFHKTKAINCISNDKRNREAIDHFFFSVK